MKDAIARRRAALSAKPDEFVTRMSPLMTAAANAQQFALDCVAASEMGKILRIDENWYPFGSSTQVLVNVTKDLIIRGGRKMAVPAGLSGVPVRISTQSLWQDYQVTAFSQTNYGTNGAPDGLSDMAEFSAITISGGPASMQTGEMFAIASNDMLDYGVEPEGYELNFQNCIGEVATYGSNVVRTSRALRRNFTPHNDSTNRWCYLRRFNNKGIKLDIDGMVLTTDGDVFDTSITTRPDAVFEIVGFQNARIGPNCHVERSWAGDWRFKLTQNLTFEATYEDLPNKPANIDALGYSPAFYGANLNPSILRKTGQRSRHSTSIWREAPFFNLGAMTPGATTTFAYTKGAGSQGSFTHAVGDLEYIEGVVGTGGIGAINGTWQKVLSRTGDANSGTITIGFNSTGMTRTSGGTAKLFEPDQALEAYGEREGCLTKGGYITGSSGSYIDSHQNDLYEVVDGVTFDAGTGFAGGSADGRPFNIRGACGTYRNSVVRGYAQLVDFAAFGGRHGMPNIITMPGGEFRDQAGRGWYSGSAYTGRGALIVNEGDASVTGEARQGIMSHWDFINIFTLINWVADGGNLTLRRCNVMGDWGPGAGLSPGEEMIKATGGEIVIDGGVWDFSNALATRIRLAQLTGAKLRLRNLRINNLFCTGSQNPILMDGAGAELDLENVVIELGSATSQRSLVSVTAGATINIRGRNQIVNSANFTANSLFSCGAATTINLFGEIVGDSPGMDLFSGAGTVTVNDRRQTTPLA